MYEPIITTLLTWILFGLVFAGLAAGCAFVWHLYRQVMLAEQLPLSQELESLLQSANQLALSEQGTELTLEHLLSAASTQTKGQC